MKDTLPSDAVLILSPREDEGLVDALFRNGLTAVVKQPSAELLARMRPGEYRALLVAGGGPDRDVLELVLNIRDYDAQVPIVVLGEGKPPWDAGLSGRLRLTWLDRRLEPHDLADRLPQRHIPQNHRAIAGS